MPGSIFTMTSSNQTPTLSVSATKVHINNNTLKNVEKCQDVIQLSILFFHLSSGCTMMWDGLNRDVCVCECVSHSTGE